MDLEKNNWFLSSGPPADIISRNQIKTKMNGCKMNTNKSLLLMACAALIFSAGCGKQQQYEVIERICVPDVGRAEVLDTAEDVLVDMHFTVDKLDVEGGFLKTRPLSGGQFFEFWRSDSVGAFNFAEANLHSIQRIAELHIRRGRSQQGRQLCIYCDVKTRRLSLLQPQAGSNSQSMQIFPGNKSLMRKLKPGDDQRNVMSWVDLGSDTRLATVILNRIKNKM